MTHSRDYEEGYRRGLEASSSIKEEARAYKEMYFKLCENISNLKALEPAPPIIIVNQVSWHKLPKWPHRVEHISELGYVVWRDVFEGAMRCSLRDAVLAHKVAVFVTQDEANDYSDYRNQRTARLGTDAI